MTGQAVASAQVEDVTAAPQPSAAQAVNRIYFLDGLRGIAALLVVTYHSASAILPAMTIGGTSPVHTPVDHFFRYAPILGLPFKGNSAVAVFFVLSGMALALGPMAQKTTTATRIAAVSGAVRRLPRLVVPAFAACALSAVLWALHSYRNTEASVAAHSGWFTGFWHGDASWLGPLREATAGIVLPSESHVYVPVLWTMRWEFLGSMLVFAILALLPPVSIRFAIYAVGLVYFRHSYLFDFIAGLALFELWRRYGNRSRAARQTRAISALFAAVGIYGLVLMSAPTPEGNGISFYRWIFPHSGGNFVEQEHVFGAALVLAAVLALAPAQAVLSTRIPRCLGRISFSVYLLHFLVLGSLGAEVFVLLHDRVPYALAALLTFTTVIAVSIAAAYVFTRLVDEPTVTQLGRLNRFVLRRGQAKQPGHGRNERALAQGPRRSRPPR